MNRELLSRLAKRLYRAPDEATPSRQSGARGNTTYVIVYLAVLVATLTFFTDLLSGEAAQWRHAFPAVELGKENWKLLENAPAADCPPDRPVGPGCPASPESPALWKNGISRFTDTGALRRKAKRDFWLGATFTPEMVKRAFEARANRLLLGWVFSDYDVFIEGRWIGRGLILQRQAAVIPLPLSDLAGGNALHVAILVHPDSEGGAPDYFAAPWKEGLATAEQAAAFESANTFTRTAKPFGLFLLNLLFSVMFFLFWTMQKRKQEYFYFALFGAVGALVQIKHMDMFRGALELTATQAFELFIYTAEGGFGLLTALAFARGRESFFRKAVPFLLITPWTLMALPFSPGTRGHLIWQLKFWLVPSLYLAGSAVCFLQAWHLHDSGRGRDLAARIRQLVYFGLGMALIAALGVAESQHVLSLITEAFVSRFTHFSVVLLLAVIALREYHEERKLLERSPVSKYHRRPELPASVRGALLCVDIKGSERLFQQSASLTGDSGRIVRDCLTQLWGAVLAEKGTVLSTAGDGLHAFFDAEDCSNPAESALRAADQMRERLGELSRQLFSQGLHHGGEFAFRAGLATGEISPIWQEVDRARVAGWSDTGAGKVFVESARLMEIERQTGAARDVSQVVVGAETAFSLRSVTFRGRWVVESRSFVGKHDHSYLVSVYQPSDAGSQPSEDEICVAG